MPHEERKPNSDFAEIAKLQKPIDYQSLLGNNTVLILSEDHFDLAPKRHLVEQAPGFKKIGITHFAVESPDLNKWPVEYYKDEYVKMAQAFAKQGINVVPIDIDQGSGRVEMGIREKYLLNGVEKILTEDQDARILVFIGGLHAGKHDFPFFPNQKWLGQRLILAGIATVTGRYIGGSLPSADFSQLKDLSGKDFMIDMRPYELWNSNTMWLYDADFIIHLHEQKD